MRTSKFRNFRNVRNFYLQFNCEEMAWLRRMPERTIKATHSESTLEIKNQLKFWIMMVVYKHWNIVLRTSTSKISVLTFMNSNKRVCVYYLEDFVCTKFVFFYNYSIIVCLRLRNVTILLQTFEIWDWKDSHFTNIYC